jgi:hypothetical protein
MGNALFYYDIITGQDPSSDIINYLGQLQGCIDTDISKSKNVVSLMYGLNMIHLMVKSLGIFVNTYCTKSPLKEKVLLNLKVVTERMVTKYFTHQEEYITDISLPYFNERETIFLANYVPETFSVPSKILTIVQSVEKNKNKYILSFRDMFVFCILYDHHYTIPDETNFASKYKKIILLSPNVIKNYNANLNTVKALSLQLYREDTNVLKKNKQSKKTIDTMKSILDCISSKSLNPLGLAP